MVFKIICYLVMFFCILGHWIMAASAHDCYYAIMMVFDVVFWGFLICRKDRDKNEDTEL